MANFRQLLGKKVVSTDGTYLGKIEKPLNPDSIASRVGKYGGNLGANSINNSIGVYGGSISQKSARNPMASSPPIIVDEAGEFVAYLTKNNFKSPRVDPDELINWLRT